MECEQQALQIFEKVASLANPNEDLAGWLATLTLPVAAQHLLTAQYIKTPLGDMLAIANEQALFHLEFTDQPGLVRQVEKLAGATSSLLTHGYTKPLELVEEELDLYFKNKITIFKTPLVELGSPFQLKVWTKLKKIPYAKTCSYAELATAIGRPSACRAVAKSNSTNKIAIIVPCHRVINSNGALGGYAGGISRKQWLISHEKVTNEDPRITLR